MNGQRSCKGDGGTASAAAALQAQPREPAAAQAAPGARPDGQDRPDRQHACCGPAAPSAVHAAVDVPTASQGAARDPCAGDCVPSTSRASDATPPVHQQSGRPLEAQSTPAACSGGRTQSIGIAPAAPSGGSAPPGAEVRPGAVGVSWLDSVVALTFPAPRSAEAASAVSPAASAHATPPAAAEAAPPALQPRNASAPCEPAAGSDTALAGACAGAEPALAADQGDARRSGRRRSTPLWLRDSATATPVDAAVLPATAKRAQRKRCRKALEGKAAAASLQPALGDLEALNVAATHPCCDRQGLQAGRAASASALEPGSGSEAEAGPAHGSVHATHVPARLSGHSSPSTAAPPTQSESEGAHTERASPAVEEQIAATRRLVAGSPAASAGSASRADVRQQRLPLAAARSGAVGPMLQAAVRMVQGSASPEAPAPGMDAAAAVASPRAAEPAASHRPADVPRACARTVDAPADSSAHVRGAPWQNGAASRRGRLRASAAGLSPRSPAAVLRRALIDVTPDANVAAVRAEADAHVQARHAPTASAPCASKRSGSVALCTEASVPACNLRHDRLVAARMQRLPWPRQPSLPRLRGQEQDVLREKIRRAGSMGAAGEARLGAFRASTGIQRSTAPRLPARDSRSSAATRRASSFGAAASPGGCSDRTVVPTPEAAAAALPPSHVRRPFSSAPIEARCVPVMLMCLPRLGRWCRAERDAAACRTHACPRPQH